MRRFAQLALATVLLFGVCAISSADTLQMKDGRVIQGKFLGGSERAVQFDVNGRTELYNVDQIISLTFTVAPAVSSAPLPEPPRRQDDQPALERRDRDQVSADNTYRPPAPRTPDGAVPAGTRLLIRMIDGVDSSKNHVGDRFHASLEADLMAGNTVIAARGSDVYGRLAQANEAGHLTGKAQLQLELTDILIYNKLQPIVTGDYEVSGQGRGSNTAKKAGGGAVAGAIIGAIAGGGKGAAIGAGVGAGAGTAINVVTRGDEVKVPSETVLDFRLEQPFVPPRP